MNIPNVKTTTSKPGPESLEKNELYRMLYGVLLMADPEDQLASDKIDLWQDDPTPAQPFLLLPATHIAR